MSANTPLDALRHEIDAIDDAIHDLIMARTKVVEQVRKEKRGQSIKIRPARECSIIYRLMERHKGPFPKRELARIWRELIVATLSFEGPFSIGIHIPGAPVVDEPSQNMHSEYWDMVRNQYGSFTPMDGYPSASTLIDAVRRNEVAIGVLALPKRAEEAPWWPLLTPKLKDIPRIINRLPFINAPENGSFKTEALVICSLPSEPTGRDHTFLVIETADEISLKQLSTAFAKAGVKLIFSSSWRDIKFTSRYLYLVEVEGFITNDDNIIQGIGESLGGVEHLIWTIGSYGKPLTSADLETKYKTGNDAL
jgi:chorismate mutase / prephenate dehydratase